MRQAIDAAIGSVKLEGFRPCQESLDQLALLANGEITYDEFNDYVKTKIQSFKSGIALEYERAVPQGKGNIKFKYVEYCQPIRVFLK
jgi:hypothetical protein